MPTLKVIVGSFLTLLIAVPFSAGGQLTTDLIVNVTDGRGGYDEGDVLHAFTSRRILDVHAQHVVHPKLMIREGGDVGRITPGSLLEFCLERTRQFKFERISARQVRRTNLRTLDEDTISDVPNASGEYMNVQLYLDRRVAFKPSQNQMFGSAGSEYWYGGITTTTDAIMDTIWTEIEARTRHVRDDEFPFTDREKRLYLIIKVDDLTDAEVVELLEPLIGPPDGEEEEPVINQRAVRLDLTNIGLTAEETTRLGDPNESNDLRHRTTDIGAAIIHK